MKSQRQIEVFCFKWGDKYPPMYVNRLANSLKKYLPQANFNCITDNPVGLNSDICCII